MKPQKIASLDFVRTSLLIPVTLKARLKMRAHELTVPDQVPVSMGEVMRRILTDALMSEETPHVK